MKSFLQCGAVLGKVFSRKDSYNKLSSMPIRMYNIRKVTQSFEVLVLLTLQIKFTKYMLIYQRNLQRRNPTSILIRGREKFSPKPDGHTDRQTYGWTYVRTGGHQYLQSSFASNYKISSEKTSEKNMFPPKLDTRRYSEYWISFATIFMLFTTLNCSLKLNSFMPLMFIYVNS